MAEHNHLTRDIKPLWSGCHGCDEYHVNALQMRIAALLAERDAARAEADKWQTIATAAQMARDDLKAEVAELKRDMQDGNEATAQVMEELRQKSAEVAALREQYVVEEFIDTDGYPSMRVVKGEHVGENQWAANIRREVLADLRAKVEGMRDGALEGFRSQPHRSHLGTMASTLERVLVLIEEAERG